MQVEGKPAPTFKFYYKGVTPLLEGIRYKFHTDGETNTITLCIRNIKTSDEGKYKIVITNSHGTFSDETQLYVSKPGCTDFRTLLRKSKYAKWGKDKGDPNWGDLKGVQKVSIFFVFNQNILIFVLIEQIFNVSSFVTGTRRICNPIARFKGQRRKRQKG